GFFATDVGGKALRVHHASLTRVVVEGHAAGSRVVVRYRIDAPLLSDDGAEVSATHAYLNPGAIVPWVDGLEGRAHELNLTGVARGWRVVSPQGDEPRLTADGYLALIDLPIEAAPAMTLLRGHRVVADARFDVVIHAEEDVERARAALPTLLDDLAAIAA